MCCGKNRQQLQMQMQKALRKGAPGSNPVPVAPTAPLPSKGFQARPARFVVGRPPLGTSPGPGVTPQNRTKLPLVPQRGPSPHN